MKNEAIKSILNGSIFLEPMNTFLYTWSFLDTINQGYSDKIRKSIVVFRNASLYTVPVIYLGLYIALVEIWSHFLLYKDEQRVQQYENALHKATKIFSALGYWTTFTNCLACTIMIFVIQFVREKTLKPLDTLGATL